LFALYTNKDLKIRRRIVLTESTKSTMEIPTLLHGESLLQNHASKFNAS